MRPHEGWMQRIADAVEWTGDPEALLEEVDETDSSACQRVSLEYGDDA